MKARDVMVRDVITVSPETDIDAAVKLLTEHDVSALPVLGENGAMSASSARLTSEDASLGDCGRVRAQADQAGTGASRMGDRSVSSAAPI